MKNLYLLLVLLLWQGAVHAQSDKEKQEMRSLMWTGAPAAFAAKETPEQWKTENAVVLAKKADYEIEKRSLMSVLDESFAIHMRVKVLNNDGIQDFSELEFEVPRTSNSGAIVLGPNLNIKFFFGARVEKKNGKVVELKDTDLVKLEMAAGSSRYEKYKIAIPELEVGDIIDYYYKLSVPHLVQNGFKSPAFDFLLSGRYPIVHQEYNILLNRNCTISAESYNGAPKFTLVAKDNNFYHFQISDSKREKYKSERWTFDYLNMPFFKFQVSFAKGSADPKLEELAKVYTKEQIRNKANYLEYFQTATSGAEHNATYSYVKQALGKEQDPVKIAEAAYYFLRNNNMTAAYEYELLLNKPLWEKINEVYFIGVLSKYLRVKKVNHEIIFTTNRQSGVTIQNLLFDEDLRMLIAVIDASGKRTYFTNFSRYSNPNELDPELEGMPAYAVNMLTSARKREAVDLTLPWTSSVQNKEVNKVKVDVALAAEPLFSVERSVSVQGHQKWNAQNQLLTGFDYLSACAERGLTLDIENFSKKNYISLSREDRKNIEEKRRQVKEELAEAHLKEYEKTLQESFSASKLKLESVTLSENGIFSDKPQFSYQEKFTLPEYIQRAGPNYLLEVGKLIGGQVAIEQKEYERQNDIQLAYAREFEYQIELSIPEGYVVEGIERLNINVQNSTGAFVSKARQEGGKLLITTRKAYLKPADTKDNWKNMIGFLDAAYQFSQQKVLLKKSPGAKR